MYSAGLNNYNRFTSGEEFQKIKDKICLMDVPVPSKVVRAVKKNVWKRSEIVRVQAIEFAGYACEINCKHKSYVA